MSKWQEVRIELNREAHEAAIERLLERGAGGVSIEDSLTYQEAQEFKWGDYVPQVIPSDRITLATYFADPMSCEQLASLKQEITALNQYGLDVGSVSLTARVVNEEDWAHAWKEYYHGETVGSIVINPSWEPYQAKPDEILINLDPGMAFGTGGHPTTAMCLGLLQKIEVANKTVWDIGTGSGLLAIAATKLGASQVMAVDTDPVAVRVAKENAQQNGEDFPILLGSLSDLSGKADLVIANIIADVIIELLPEIPKKLTTNGLFIASGIIEHRAADVKEAARDVGLTIREHQVSGEWTAYLLEKDGEDA